MTLPAEAGRLILHYGGGEDWTTATHLRHAIAGQASVWEMNDRQHCHLDGIRPRDRYLWVESGMSSYPLDPERSAGTTAGYLIDVHLHPQLSMLQSMLFDVVFVAQRDYVPVLARCHPAVHWLPLAAPSYFLQLPRGRLYEVAFVGRSTGLPARTALLYALEQRFRMNDWRRFHTTREMGRVYAQARIVLNLPVRADLNMRFFEAMSAGAALMQPPIANGVRLVATAGVHYMESDAFTDFRRLVAELAALLRNDEPEKMGSDARELVAEYHTYEHRLATIQRVMDGATPTTAPIRRFTRGQRRRLWALLSRTTGESGLIKHLLRRFPEAPVKHPVYLGGALVSCYRRRAGGRP